ncbi:ESCRT-0 subunit protein hse1 [Geranomyces michiganensis]|nr:ESCRT-0 subunit protein hse1 [Geranomyces michiganensis]
MSSLEELITKATSETNTGEDWGLIISICEKADRSETSAREAVQILVRRVQHRNVNVVLFTLTVANSLVHNCGSTVRREIASRAFVDALVKQVHSKTVHEVVRTRILDFIQQWADAFRSDSSLGFMVDSYNTLKAQGAQFPSPHKPDVVKTQAMINKEKEDEELQLALALSLSAQDTGGKARRPQQQQSQQQHQADHTSRPSGPKVLFQVRALYDFPGAEEGELRLVRGDVVDVYDATTFQEWWKGESASRIGIFPSNYVEKIVGGVAAAATHTATVYADASRASKDGEADVVGSRKKIQEFSAILSGIDPRRDSFAENEQLQVRGVVWTALGGPNDVCFFRNVCTNMPVPRFQQTYSDILLLRPKLLKLLETYRAKQGRKTFSGYCKDYLFLRCLGKLISFCALLR